ncbi:MAG TPA: helix-turn-helix transcriptional regulator [Thermoanaerobaculia bacterium]|nr:helix-turn-helix transcriptional regulator [Thermoanaerobaculia bacterium]
MATPTARPRSLAARTPLARGGGAKNGTSPNGAWPERVRQVQLVGRKIRQLRKQHKLTQTELSSRIGIQQSDLSRMEKGEYRVSLDTLFRILAEFHMGVGEFFDEVNREAIPPQDARLLRDIRALDTDTQREIESFIAFKRTQQPGSDTE